MKIPLTKGDDDTPASGFVSLLSKCESLVKANGSIVGAEIAAQLGAHKYTTLRSVIPPPNEQGAAFLAGIDGRTPVTHQAVGVFLQEFGDTLHSLGFGRGHRVALVLPNGPELALAILAVSQWATCVPLSATGASQELAADLKRCGADLVVGPYCAGPLPTTAHRSHPPDADREATCNCTTDATEFILQEMAETVKVMEDGVRDWTVHHHVQDLAQELGIAFVGLVPDPDQAGPFRLWVPPLEARKKTRSTLRTHQDVPLNYDALPVTFIGQALIGKSGDSFQDEQDSVIAPPKELFQPNSGTDEALVLFTSGTTGNKKLVPHQIQDILTAATTIALSWELLPTDVNCNLMPLFHVGGIIRQVFSPLVSGGTVICCPSFDADLFWALWQRKAFNWYYAAPTMHQIILQTGKANLGKTAAEIQSQHRLKMIANAAGGLLPSLAQEMKDTFGAAILPSYGMTECMPISSPPATYALTKPGTSGVPVGPEVAILNTFTLEPLPPREEGPICVRGDPCFRGYGVLADDPSGQRPESFMKEGWFNTGDLGFLDEDGYLYITGRSKEVINRGGEIISPMEVEEAVQAHPDVKLCAAFSASHDVLQETVGIAVVLHNQDGIRNLDLPTLHAFVADKLATPKWPQCLVFMERDLPKSHTNKLLRVKLAERLGLPEFTDLMSYWERTFDAKCPELGAALTEPIPSQPVVIDPSKVQAVLREATKSDAVWVVPHSQRPGALVAHVGSDVKALDLIQHATDSLHRYEIPTHVCPLEDPLSASTTELAMLTPHPKHAVASILNNAKTGEGDKSDEDNDPFIPQVQEIFLDLLGLDYIPSPNLDFFQIGGSSMTASQLASKVRKTFGVACSGAEVFHHSTSVALVGLIRSRMDSPSQAEDSAGGGSSANRNFHQSTFPGKRIPPLNTFLGSLFQLIPMFVIFPIWQILRYLLFFATLLQKSRMYPDVSDRDFLSFLIAYLAFHVMWMTCAPMVFIFLKWVVIGQYTAGRYPIWGNYYLRWWFVDVCRKLLPRGIWGMNEMTLTWYYRILGANIKAGARISMECEMAEYDLVKVGTNAAVEQCILRGFGVDNGCMLLGRVNVGDNASVGVLSVVAPDTSVPEGQHLGPGTSTYDDTPGKALHPKHARVNRKYYVEPSLCSQWLLGFPLSCIVNAAGLIPPMAGTYALLYYKSRETTENFFQEWNDIMDWLCDPRRIPFFFAIRVARALFSPFFYMAFALLVKWVVIGKIEPGVNRHSEWETFRIWMVGQLFTRKRVQAVTDLIGRHYENVSVLYRLMGAKVGKRVFWPGKQPICGGVYDLLEIGDDVVFGSRSALLTISIDRKDKIVLCAGSNVSDNCIVMPGSVIGRNAVLGSNSICPEGRYLPSGSVWFGNNGAESSCLDPGDGGDASQYQRFVDDDNARGTSKGSLLDGKMFNPPLIASAMVDSTHLQMTGDATTIRPFGKAVYQGRTKGYWSLPVPVIILYTWFWRIFCCVFHTFPLLLAVQCGAVLLYSDDVANTLYEALFGAQEGKGKGAEQTEFKENGRIFNEDGFLWFTRDFDNEEHYHTFSHVITAVLICFLFTHFLRVLGWLIIELGAKWAFMGRRKPGRYNYDTSSYAQRWELYQLTAKIRKISRLNLLQFIAGTPYIKWYFQLNGCKVGRDVCLYPAGADPLMPEPDLITIGDRTVIDCASIVGHLNTRGNFELKPIIIERDCTLRTRSRVQQGVHMEAGSMLLEKSVAMTGEVIDKRSVWQGGPASMWFRYPENDQVGGAGYTPPTAAGQADIEMANLTNPGAGAL